MIDILIHLLWSLLRVGMCLKSILTFPKFEGLSPEFGFILSCGWAPTAGLHIPITRDILKRHTLLKHTRPPSQRDFNS